MLSLRGAALAQDYNLTDLGALPGQDNSKPSALNNQAQVVGVSSSRAFLWSSGAMQQLVPLAGGTTTGAFGINNNGQAVGESTYTGSGNIRHATLWSGASVLDLGVLPGDGGPYSRATAINDTGKVTGFAGPGLDSDYSTAFIWDTQNGMRSLGGGKGFSINTQGYVAGLRGPLRAGFSDGNSGMRDLGTIGGEVSEARAINGSNHIVGTSTINNYDNRKHAFLYDGLSMRDLGAVGASAFESDRSFAYALNNYNQVVGSSYRPYTGGALYQIAFVYRNGAMHDLNTLLDASGNGYHLYSATGINDAGQIIAEAAGPNGLRAVLLTPATPNTGASPTPAPTPRATLTPSPTVAPSPTPVPTPTPTPTPFHQSDLCSLPGSTVASDSQGDQAAPGTPQHDLVAVMFAEPPQSDGIDRVAVTMKVANLDPANLPPSTSWRTYFFVNQTGRHFVSVDKGSVNEPPKFQYGAVINGVDTVQGVADSGALSAADRTLMVTVATSKLGAQPGDSLIDVNAQTHMASPVNVATDRAPDDNPSPATYRLVGNAACSPLPVEVISAASREPHQNVGPLLVSLPPAGRVGVESRATNGVCTVLFRFANPLLSVRSASVTSGTATIASSAIDSNDARVFTLNLTGVTNAQVLTLTLQQVVDSAGNIGETVSSLMGVLEGDANGDGIVNIADVNEALTRQGQAITASSFRSDVNRDGAITREDVRLIESRLGTSLVRILSCARSAEGKVTLRGVGIPSRTHPIEATENLTDSFSRRWEVTADTNGFFQFDDPDTAKPNAADIPQRFYRVVIP